MFSVIFLPATLTASIWGMNVGGIPFSDNPNGFWVVGGLIAAVFALVAIVLFRFRFSLFRG
jgi:zinc transporter